MTYKVGDKTTLTDLRKGLVVPVTLLSKAGHREWFVETEDGKAYRTSEDWLEREGKK